MNKGNGLLLLICLLFMSCKIYDNKQLNVFVIDKKSRYERYLRGIESDSIICFYKSVNLGLKNTLPSSYMSNDSLLNISRWVKNNFENDIVDFIKKNDDFVLKYYNYSKVYAAEQVSDIDMCKVIADSCLQCDDRLLKSDLRKIVDKMNEILVEKPKNNIVSFVVSTAPNGESFDEVVFIQRTILDDESDCCLAHSGFVRNNFRLNIDSNSYFKLDPELEYTVGYFENTTLVIINVPMLQNNKYIADFTITILKE